MLRIFQSNSATGAMKYFSRADYYSEGQELIGQWRGEAAERLGLGGEITKEAWDALCCNRNPATGERLTLRNKENRRVGYDFTFDAHKSVSVLYGLTRDERILDAFRESVRETMNDIEREMKTRVRKDGKNATRTTGNFVWGEYVHFTSRPVDGVPDPHLHVHAFAFNATWDEKEAAWKAGEFGDIKRDARYFEAKCDSRFARRLADLGIAVERTKTGWELAGVPASAIEKFSRRTAEIEAEAKRKGIVDPAQKAELGAKTRQGKEKELGFDELQGAWRRRLSGDEWAAIDGVAFRVGGKAIVEDARAPLQAVRHAAEHWFERKSVVPERTVLAEAMRQAVGTAGPEAVEDAFRRHDLVFGERDGRRMVTTRGVVSEEMRMLAFARDGRGTEHKLGETPHTFKNDDLNEGQRQAVLHLLGSRDRVTIVRGGAGTGKTTMMQEAVAGIEATGRKVFAFAPTTDASHRVLRGDGFEDAETVARLMADPRLHERIHGQVVWVDEAGLLGTGAMAKLFDLAEKVDARIILTGDRRQHGSVERGAALRLLEEEAGIKPADLREIERQEGEYRMAVKALSDGMTEDGFRRLDKLGWIREMPDEDRYRVMATDYVNAIVGGKSALVVSPTHREGARIVSEIRSELRKRDYLGKDERQVLQLTSDDLTTSERRDLMHYAPGRVVEFQQNAKGFRKGQRLLTGRDSVPLDHAEKFQLYKQGTLSLSRGDLIRITKNGRTADGKHRLNNGMCYRVAGFTKDGDIMLENGWRLAGDYGHLTHGYVATSFAAQGRTVDRVLIGQSAESFPASSREQFYVSVSRGREQATIYTSDKEALLEAVNRSDDRLTATEFINLRQRREHGAKLQAREQTAIERTEHLAREKETMTHER